MKNIPLNMTTGEKIKYMRKQRNLTQEQLGEMVGVQKAAINKYETGAVVNLKREMINNLAKALDVSQIYLMSDEDVASSGYYSGEYVPEKEQPITQEARIISGGIDKMPKEKREQALKVLQTVFSEYFGGGKEDET